MDATFIAAPVSIKNMAHACGPEMRHTCKGRPYYFGPKAHIGVDAESRRVYNVANMTATVNLMHGEEAVVFADAGDIGPARREELKNLEGTPSHGHSARNSSITAA